MRKTDIVQKIDQDLSGNCETFRSGPLTENYWLLVMWLGSSKNHCPIDSIPFIKPRLLTSQALSIDEVSIHPQTRH